MVQEWRIGICFYTFVGLADTIWYYLQWLLLEISCQVQYRMHPCLSEFPSQSFYDGSLQNGWGSKFPHNCHGGAWWKWMKGDPTFHRLKLSTKSNSGVPARGHLERASLCGNWLPMASSGTKKWEWSQSSHDLVEFITKVVVLSFWYISPLSEEWVIWGPDMPMFFLNSTGAEEISASGTSYLNRTEAGSLHSYVSYVNLCKSVEKSF